METVMDVLGVPVSDVGPWTIVLFVVVLVLTGKLVPGRERDYWRDAAQTSMQQNTKILEAVEVTKQVLQTIDRTARGGGSHG